MPTTPCLPRLIATCTRALIRILLFPPGGRSQPVVGLENQRGTAEEKWLTWRSRGLTVRSISTNLSLTCAQVEASTYLGPYRDASRVSLPQDLFFGLEGAFRQNLHAMLHQSFGLS